MIKNYILIFLLTILMFGAFGYGIFRSGSPFETRGRKFDEQRVSDISSLSYSIESYYRQKGMLPKTLNDIPRESLYGKGITDPESEKEYDYQITGNTNYRICADFSTDSAKKDKSQQNLYNFYGSNSKFDHPKGNHCFELNTEGVVLNPSTAPSPSVQTINSGASDTSELAKRGRDAARLSDLANLQNAINVTVQESTSSSSILCSGGIIPGEVCTGDSLTGGRKSDGTGWIEVNLGGSKAISVPILPIDPINDGIFHYTYCSDRSSWEINAALESTQQQTKMGADGGDSLSLYEVGSNLTLIGNNGKCRY